jgi:hypothetical protein
MSEIFSQRQILVSPFLMQKCFAMKKIIAIWVILDSEGTRILALVVADHLPKRVPFSMILSYSKK